MRVARPATISIALALLTASAIAPPGRAHAQSIDLARHILVDLTHDLATDSPTWPGSRTPFKLDTITASDTGAMFRLVLNEHFATHMDAPRHGSGAGWSNEQIPLARLVAPVVVIDVSAQSTQDRDYALSVADVEAHEHEFGRIPRGAIVLLRTGWARYWDTPARYFGADSAAKPTLHFPSFGVEAARALVARGAGMLGVDSPSTDVGAAVGFAVHGILGAANVPALENLADLSALPRTGALLLALPIKTRGGSGGPVRVVALIPH